MKAFIIKQKEIDKFVELYNLKADDLKTRPPYEMSDNILWEQAIESAKKTFQYYFLTFLSEQGE